MIWSTVWIEAVVFTALFTAMVMIPTIKHPEIGVHNYPPDIQEEYFKTYEHVPVAPLSAAPSRSRALASCCSRCF